MDGLASAAAALGHLTAPPPPDPVELAIDKARQAYEAAGLKFDVSDADTAEQPRYVPGEAEDLARLAYGPAADAGLEPRPSATAGLSYDVADLVYDDPVDSPAPEPPEPVAEPPAVPRQDYGTGTATFPRPAQDRDRAPRSDVLGARNAAGPSSVVGARNAGGPSSVVGARNDLGSTSDTRALSYDDLAGQGYDPEPSATSVLSRDTAGERHSTFWQEQEALGHDTSRLGSDTSRRGQARPKAAARRAQDPRAASRMGSGRGRRPGAGTRVPRTRRLAGSADRMSAGAVVFSILTGLALLAVVERTVIEGGPIGASGPARSERPLDRPADARTKAPDQAQPQRSAPAIPTKPQVPGAPVPNVQTLTSQIRELTRAQAVVDVDRLSQDRTWAFGTAAVPAVGTAMPRVSFFAARWTQGKWAPALSGTGAYTGLLSQMPAAVMSPEEARVLTRHSVMTAAQAGAATNGSRVGDGLMLPWRIGGVWTMGTAEGGGRPLGTLTFWGGDGKVLSAGDGRLYHFCGDGGLVMVVHRSGLASTYYRMRAVTQIRDGSVVKRGEQLGLTGDARVCGGAPSPRPEVQFGLRRGAEDMPFDGVQIGGWTFRERANPLLGYAERGPLQVLAGGVLANMGPVPSAEAPVEPTPPANPNQKGKKPGAN